MLCAHNFKPSAHNCYLKCGKCGSYRSLSKVPPADLYGPDYWTHAQGHSTIEEQAYNVDGHREGGVTKYEFVLSRIKTPDRSASLEIGCLPGRLLLLLQGIGRFERVLGIETYPAFETPIRQVGCYGGPLLFGFFPACTYSLADETFSFITALDVFEHSPEPGAFLAECARLLKPQGQLLLMLPVADDSLPERFFEPHEHVWIHSRQALVDMLWQSGFCFDTFDEWCPGHTTVSAFKQESA